MAINLKESKTLSLLILIITFFIFLGILNCIKPNCIMKMDENGQLNMNYLLLISYSLLFAGCCAIIVILCNYKQNNTSEPQQTKTNKPKTQKYGKNTNDTTDLSFNFSSAYKLF